MLTYIRYALASFCFAASVGCLLLWVHDPRDDVYCTVPLLGNKVQFEASDGIGFLGWLPLKASKDAIDMYHFAIEDNSRLDKGTSRSISVFGVIPPFVYFHLWYPALTFALAGVGVLRFRRQFSIRSALIWLTVVAALLGMAVGL